MASSSSTEHKWKYDVFLSFRGEDARHNFVSHLYDALRRNQVKVFIDNKLKRGGEIEHELLTTIEESRISVITFSENYASSSWCLDELVKILECQKKYGQIVLPVFYRVDPSDVRKHTGSFGEAFTKLQKNFKGKMDKVRRWKEDLTKAANLSGWDSQNIRDDSKLVNEIAESILEELGYKSPTYSKGLVGMDLRVKKIKELLRIGSSGVRIIGIWGIGGIGKTTIAEEVFHNISNEYHRCCFLSNVGQELKEGRGLTHLRQELFSKILGEKDLKLETPKSVPIFIRNRLQDAKVLAVLDDVEDHIQLEGIIENRDLFGDGSRIIVIARDKQAFNTLADEQYEVKGLNDQEARQLFSLNAFKRNTPPKGYMGLSMVVMKYANGHPLALKVLGDFLYGKDEQVWESELNELEHILEPTLGVLKLGVDKLHEKVKSMFLDIACFFRGEHVDFVMEILERPNFSAKAIFPTLISKGLIKISNNKVEMHDLVQQMAHKIVQQDDLEKRHRFFNPDDSYELLTIYEGTRNVEGLVADISRMKRMEVTSTTFQKMHNLRFLKFYKSRVGNDSKVDLPHGLESLSDKLRYLHWEEYPLKSLPSDFDPKNLVVLNLSCSNVKQLWNGNKTLANLKEVNLSNCKDLIAIPELTNASKLERLILQFCTSLMNVPSLSIQTLKKLIDLDLRGCTNLMSFPRRFDSTSLKTINLSGCPHLKKYPKIAGTAAYLNLSGTAIEELPQSVTHLNGLVTLNLKDCKQLGDLSSDICSLKSLVIADFSGCANITSFPVVSQSVRYLYLGGTGIEQLPSSIGRNLPWLSLLDLSNCKRLKSIPNTFFSCLEKLNLSGCSSITNFPEVSWNLKELSLDETTIQEIPSSIQRCSGLVELHLKDCTRLETVPESICKLKHLLKLNLSGCSKLRNFPEILEGMDSLRYLYLDRTALTELPALKLECLHALNLVDCQISEVPESLSYLSSLEVLDLSGNTFMYLPESINKLSELQYLGLRHCKNLTSLPELPPRLTKLDADNCGSLFTTSTFTSVVEVSNSDFCFSRCYNLGASACKNIIDHVLKKIELYCKTLQNSKIWAVAEGEISCFFPGELVPRWFAQQNHGSSITIQLPPDRSYSEFMGFTLCSVVDFRHSQQVNGFQINCRYHFKNTNGNVRILHCEFGGWYDDRNVIEFYPQDIGCSPLLCCEVVRCGVQLLYAHGEVSSFDHEYIASTSSTISTWKYDVIIGFKGEVRVKNFTDHIYAALKRRGIITFKGDEKLERAEELPPERRAKKLRAIELSYIIIVIISRNCASSTWWLHELVKILDCYHDTLLDQIVLPVFFEIDPWDLSKQKGSIEEVLAKHEKVNATKVESWRFFEQVYDLNYSTDRDESELIEIFAEHVLKNLKVRTAALVGIDKRIEKVLSLCEHSTKEVVRVGIWVAGGVRKACSLFHRISATFEDSCLIENVTKVLERHGDAALWRKLGKMLNVEDFSRGILTQGATIKKRLQQAEVLLVFDDVDEWFLMEFRWMLDGSPFSEGSKVMFTSRYGEVLWKLVDIGYVVDGLCFY